MKRREVKTAPGAAETCAQTKGTIILRKEILRRFIFPILDVLDNYQYDVASRQINQLNFLYNYSSISPSFLYHRIIEAFSYRDQQSFVDDIRLYRRELMQTLMELDKKDEKSFHLFFLPNYMSGQPVEKESIPQFREVNRTFAGIVQKNMLFIGVFLFEMLALFVMCQLLFSRYDIR